MNDDLISRSAVLDALKTEEGAAILGNSHVRYLKAKKLFEELPAVDAVVPVRCWECVFCREVQGIGREHHWKTCKLLCADVQDEGFCYWGERKENE